MSVCVTHGLSAVVRRMVVRLQAEHEVIEVVLCTAATTLHTSGEGGGGRGRGRKERER